MTENTARKAAAEMVSWLAQRGCTLNQAEMVDRFTKDIMRAQSQCDTAMQSNESHEWFGVRVCSYRG